MITISYHLKTWHCQYVTGLGYGPINTSVTAITQRNLPGKSKLAATVELIGSIVGFIISPYMVRLLVNEYGWRWALRFHGIIGVNLAVITWIMRTPVKTTAKDATPLFRKKLVKNFHGFLKLFTNVQFMIALVSHILFAVLAYYTVNTVLLLYLSAAFTLLAR